MRLSARKPNNPLRSLIFADGVIKDLSKNGRQVKLTFVDYCGTPVEISFTGVSRVLVDEHVAGTEVMDELFHWTATNWVLNFKNDDGETVLEISYEHAAIGDNDGVPTDFKATKEATRDVREAVIDVIDLLAHRSKQIEYEQNVPLADVPAELISCFCDDLYHPKSEQLLDRFTESELKGLAHLYGVMSEASNIDADSVTELVKHPKWSVVVRVAKDLAAYYQHAHSSEE